MTRNGKCRRRILFVVENITLAQVVRLLALARRLDPSRYDVHFACSDFDPLWFRGAEFTQWPLFTIDKEQALLTLAKGNRLYDAPVLKQYVEQELALIDRVRPDLIVGDFRLSLAVSAPLSRVPLATLINAYWSPYAVREGFPVPDHPIVKLLGPEVAARYFPQAVPRVFAHFAAPLNAVRQAYGLAPIGSLLEVLTFGDYTLYPDIPELCPTHEAPEHHRYLGAVSWAPEVSLPGFWEQLDVAKPLVYVTLGSSGTLEALPVVLQALATVPVQAVLATAARSALREVPENVHVADYVPGHLVARRSAFVVTNGGSSTGYQALTEGVPVLGIPSNMDQYLAMTAIERAGAGLLVRGGGITVEQARRALLRLLDSGAHRRAAHAVAARFSRYDCHERFGNWLEHALLSGQPGQLAR